MVDSSSSSSSSVFFLFAFFKGIVLWDLRSFHIEYIYMCVAQFTFSFSVEKPKKQSTRTNTRPCQSKSDRGKRVKKEGKSNTSTNGNVLHRCDRHHSLHQFSFVSISFSTELSCALHVIDFHVHFLRTTQLGKKKYAKLKIKLSGENAQSISLTFKFWSKLLGAAMLRRTNDNRIEK